MSKDLAPQIQSEATKIRRRHLGNGRRGIWAGPKPKECWSKFKFVAVAQQRVGRLSQRRRNVKPGNYDTHFLARHTFRHAVALLALQTCVTVH